MKITVNDSNRWRGCATIEGCLILVSAFAFLLPINQMVEGAASSSYHYSYHRQYLINKWSTTKNIPPVVTPIKLCYSAECIRTASAVLRKMKTEVEPCDDFYQFACGNFIDETKIADDKVFVNTFSVVEDKLNEQLKDIITAETDEAEPKHFKLPNLIYQACMNETLIESLGVKPIEQISDSLGGWPVIVGESWDSNDTWTWQETVQKLRRIGFDTNSIVTFYIGADFKNSTKPIITLDESTTILSREVAMKGLTDTLVSAYYDYMVDFAVLLGAERETAERELKEALQFEIDLTAICWAQEKRRDANDLYNLITIKKMQESYPYVDWLAYINGLLPAGLKVDENEVINLTEPSFFHDLGELLRRTNNRTIANYMIWRIHMQSASFLSKDFRNIKLRYDTVATGRRTQAPRGEECVNLAKSSFEIPLGSLYVRKHFKQDSKAIALEMVENIRGVFNKTLDEVDWMDKKTKEKAKRKLNAMATYIGYPDEMLDNDKLQENYGKLEIDPAKYFESYLNMRVLYMDHHLNNLKLPVNKTEWIRHANPAVVNAFHSSFENSIQFPAGVLQGHFFSGQRPKYMNYGAIGWIIGHEITHGFDDRGRTYDADGNLVDWWQHDTRDIFLEKAKCIIEQYGNYTDKQTGLNLNGINTQSENIADNGGIKMAYLAYKKHVAANGEEPRLPGLNYTPNQMFWISAAQNYCEKFRTENRKIQIATGVHSPGEFRDVGSLSNMKDFSLDFPCPEGTPMNPVHKCEVW